MRTFENIKKKKLTDPKLLNGSADTDKDQDQCGYSE